MRNHPLKQLPKGKQLFPNKTPQQPHPLHKILTQRRRNSRSQKPHHNQNRTKTTPHKKKLRRTTQGKHTVVHVKRNCSIRHVRTKHHLILNKISVPYRHNLLNRSSTSIIARTLVSTVLNTVHTNSVNGLFPSASPTCRKTSDVGLLSHITGLTHDHNCHVLSYSYAVNTRTPGLTPCHRRVQRGVTSTVNLSLKDINLGTAAARHLNFIKHRRNVRT